MLSKGIICFCMLSNIVMDSNQALNVIRGKNCQAKAMKMYKDLKKRKKNQTMQWYDEDEENLEVKYWYFEKLKLGWDDTFKLQTVRKKNYIIEIFIPSFTIDMKQLSLICYIIGYGIVVILIFGYWKIDELTWYGKNTITAIILLIGYCFEGNYLANHIIKNYILSIFVSRKFQNYLNELLEIQQFGYNSVSQKFQKQEQDKQIKIYSAIQMMSIENLTNLRKLRKFAFDQIPKFIQEMQKVTLGNLIAILIFGIGFFELGYRQPKALVESYFDYKQETFKCYCNVFLIGFVLPSLYTFVSLCHHVLKINLFFEKQIALLKNQRSIFEHIKSTKNVYFKDKIEEKLFLIKQDDEDAVEKEILTDEDVYTEKKPKSECDSIKKQNFFNNITKQGHLYFVTDSNNLEIAYYIKLLRQKCGNESKDIDSYLTELIDAYDREIDQFAEEETSHSVKIFGMIKMNKQSLSALGSLVAYIAYRYISKYGML